MDNIVTHTCSWFSYRLTKLPTLFRTKSWTENKYIETNMLSFSLSMLLNAIYTRFHRAYSYPGLNYNIDMYYLNVSKDVLQPGSIAKLRKTSIMLQSSTNDCFAELVKCSMFVDIASSFCSQHSRFKQRTGDQIVCGLAFPFQTHRTPHRTQIQTLT